MRETVAVSESCLSSITETKEDDTAPRSRRSTAYERLEHDLSNDQRILKEVTLGKRIGFYRIRGELGSGNFSQVKMGIHALTKERVAIKILDKTKLDQKTQRLLSREISSMERLHHQNVIRLYEVVETLAKLYIVMEYAGGGELYTKISNEGKLSEADAKLLYAQIIAAVKHMHEHNIIHRDLKAENVFFAGRNVVKVGDFGFSTSSREEQTLNTFCGSPPYAAPELFRDESYKGIYVDLWALGIMLYFMVTGIMPFRAETVAKLKKCILDGQFTVPSYVSESCTCLIKNILKPSPQERFSISQIKLCDWLDGQEFPAASEPYELNPSTDTSTMKDDELEARKMLEDLGIKDEHFKQAAGKDSRSSIVGTYRIMLHKVQRKSSTDTEQMLDHLQSTNVKGRENNLPKLQKKQSKLCVIV